MIRSPAPLLGFLVVVVTGCAAGGAGVSGSDEGAATSVAPSNDAASDGPVPSLEGVPAELLATLVADAATRADVEPSEITAVRGGPVEFSDGSLDCPEPGMGYTQAIVPGYQVILDAAGTELDYRVGAGDAFLVCLDGRPAP